MGRSRSHRHLPRDPDCGTGGTSLNVHLLLDLQDCVRTSGEIESKLAGKTLVLGYHAGDWRAVRRYVSCLICNDALDFANLIKVVMEKHTDLVTVTLGPIHSDSSVSLLSISGNLSQDR